MIRHGRHHTVQDLRSLFERGSPGCVLDFPILQKQHMLTCMLVSLARELSHARMPCALMSPNGSRE